MASCELDALNNLGSKARLTSIERICERVCMWDAADGLTVEQIHQRRTTANANILERAKARAKARERAKVLTDAATQHSGVYSYHDDDCCCCGGGGFCNRDGWIWSCCGAFAKDSSCAGKTPDGKKTHPPLVQRPQLELE